MSDKQNVNIKIRALKKGTNYFRGRMLRIRPMSLSQAIWKSQNFTPSPLNPPEGDLKDICFEKITLK
ncbi:MAG: hypothetical protein CVV49_07715 [Spirochaetae bacterium HGW-Spirochaetae-5]|nr:MAG: hypothetical protein CVV49_07715 [Spirochaetae bacterium HGW-Spirochaetae-5]